MPRPALVTFTSLLLPPIRVSLSTVQSFCRPQCAPALAHATRRSPWPSQSRSINLYKTARAVTALGQYKVLTFEPYTIPARSDSQHKVNLVKGINNRAIIAADITLQELYDNHVKPGEMLYLCDAIDKKLSENPKHLAEKETASTARNYTLQKAHSQTIKIKNRTKGAMLSELKVIPLALSQPASHLRYALDRAYQFVEAGSPVEVRIAIKRGQSTRMSRITRGDESAWPWMHNHFPHLRPDFILRAMPPDTVYLIDPVSDGKELCWVMANKEKKVGTAKMLSQRLFKVKEAVKKSIDRGDEEGLPRQLKAVLQEERERKEDERERELEERENKLGGKDKSDDDSRARELGWG
ncbi:hypothetical protein IQ07DRAFT_592088 [Pyrenochaeta sp. DS3sAY3a]|nr:hypothetical protein IQ07DRAFT_592088 [Pyrenochaeta sp. DS3sAY3a]